MTDSESRADDTVSLFTLGAVLVVRWHRIALVGAVTGMLVGGWAFLRPVRYRSVTSFFSQQSDPSRLGLLSLAGQFGITVPASQAAGLPEFYVGLVRSPAILRSVVQDTLDLGADVRTPFLAYFAIGGRTDAERVALGVQRLRRMIETQVTKATGVVEVSVESPEAGASQAILTLIMDAVQEFFTRTRQGQATVERRFVEDRMKVAEADLRDAEDRLEQYIRANRAYQASPELSLQAGRLQRTVNLRQAVFTSLVQAYDDVRIREVRDTPAITVIDPPSLPADREARRTLFFVMIGTIIGVLATVTVVLASQSLSAAVRAGDRSAKQFVDAWSVATGDMVLSVRRLIFFGRRT